MTGDAAPLADPPRSSWSLAAIDAAAALLDDGLSAVAGMHTAIARKPFAVLRRAPAIGTAAEPVRMIHDGVTTLVYGGLSGSLRAAAAAARLAARLAPGRREPRVGSAAGLAVAAVNGIAGDHLERRGNPLATQTGLRYRGRPVAARRQALVATYPRPSARVAVFVHGLACDESLWWRDAVRHYGDATASYGTRLQAELGLTPLYVRYNSGLPIAENGRRLARLLDDVEREWPLPLTELVLVGHSMGGLVLRSAAHHGGDMTWASRVTHAFYLGAPHRGAPLEKAANAAAWALGWSDVTRPLAVLLNRRSRGIKDLRFGALRDEDWAEVDVDALLDDRTADLPLLAGATHHFIAATLTRDPRHPLGVVVGDLLVRFASAGGRPPDLPAAPDRVRHLGPMTHLELLNHPAVYEQIRAALA